MIDSGERSITISKAKKILYPKISKEIKKTLDFGCGIGQFSSLFDPKKYYGVDTDKKYIKFCRHNHNGTFLTIETSPPYKFNKEYFDQIFISAVIHHIDNKKLSSISRELKRILKDNGEIMIIDHFIKKDQKNLFCKFLISIDRGNHFRNPDNAFSLFSKDFKLKKLKSFRNGPYKDYMLILKKRQFKRFKGS